jgi:DNA-binding response OmpR family regulator
VTAIPHQQGTRWPVRGSVRVLLMLDHQPRLTELVQDTLNHLGFVFRNVTTSAEAAKGLASWQPHLVVIDMEHADPSVIEHMGDPAAGGKRLPVIGLTHASDLNSRLTAFGAGVDDVLSIPFAPEELLARVIALLRRSYSDVATLMPVIKVGDLVIDILNRTVRAGTSELHLTSLEQGLLYLLASNAGRVISREEILDTLWGTNYVADSNVVDRQIRNLRARLHDDWKQPRFISTVAGRGYRFLSTTTPDVEEAPATKAHQRAT